MIVLSVPLALSTSACGPSIQSIHEGSVRFEHCYRLDLDPKIAPSHRHACWEQWTAVYSYGQARDRIEYARRRMGELEEGDPDPPRLNLDESETRPEREFYMSMPTPTDAHAPPPPMATTPKEEPPPKQVVPGDDCVIRCRQQRSACLKACELGTQDTQSKPAEGQRAADPAAEEPAASDEDSESKDTKCACEADYKACAVRCFE